MASALCCGAAATVASVRRRRSVAAAAAAICALTLGLSNLFPPLSSSAFKSISATPLSQSNRGIQSRFRSVHSIRMAGADSGATVVPCVVVYVTVPNKELGKKLAEGIVREKLAACVNRVPGIQSVYLWQGEIETDNEELLIMKTRESLLDALTEHVKANHEYVVPEVIALPITGGSIRYLEWIKNSTRD